MPEILSAPTTETAIEPREFMARQVKATFLLLAFYIYCVVAVFLGATIGLLVLVGALRAGFLWPLAATIGSVMLIFLRALRLQNGAEFHIQLQPADAPLFFSDIEKVCAALNVAPPREVVIESGPNAYVKLDGAFTGKGKTRLGFGFDFLAGLSLGEARAVLAHEIAHAKHVKRGYQGFLMKGLVRLSRAEDALGQVAAFEGNSGVAKATARAFNFLPRRIVKKLTKLVASCSRYDEFLADRVAAQIIGPDLMQKALLSTYVIDHQGEKIGWRDRLLHLGRAPGYTAWLQNQFHVPDDKKRLEIEGRAIERAHRSEFSTHPALPDRLNALGMIAAPAAPIFAPDEQTAARWLLAPDETAKVLLGEIERVAAKEEAKATKELMKEARKIGPREQQWGKNGIIGVGVFLLLVGAGIMWAGFFTGSQSSNLEDQVLVGAFGLAFAIGGAWMIFHRPLQVSEIPIPSLAVWRQFILDWKFKKREYDGDAGREKWKTWREAQEAEIRAALPEKNKKQQVAAALEIAHAAIGECDFPRAAAAACVAFEIDKSNPHAQRVFALTGAALWGTDTSENLNFAREKLNDFSTGWATAWTLSTWGASEGAEQILLDLCRKRQKNLTLLAFLADAQSENGKARESLATLKRALEAAPMGDNGAETRRGDEACIRHALLENHLTFGQMDEAKIHLDWLREWRARREIYGLTAFALDLAEVRFLIAHGDDEAALARVYELQNSLNDAGDLFDLARSLAPEAERVFKDAAEPIYRKVLETGHSPAALLSLARLHFEREQNDAALDLLFSALSLEKEVAPDAVPTLSLLGYALDLRREIADLKPERVAAYELEFDAATFSRELLKLGFLVLAPDETSAKNFGLEILRALFPANSEEELATRLMTKLADNSEQPDEPAPPGVYFWRGEEKPPPREPDDI